MSGPRPRRIVIVRHAQTVDNAANIWQGHRDSALSEHGEAQVAAMAPVVARYEPEFVVSSDLQRASRTAQAIADAAGLAVHLDARLREVHVGRWQGLHAEAVKRDYPDLVAALDRGEDVPKGVTGETRAQVAARAGEAITEVADSLGPGQTAVVVAHGVSGKYAMGALAGLHHDVVDEAFRSLDNCHWVELLEVLKSFSTVARWRIASYNIGAASGVHPGAGAPIWVP